jgi:hypothetical protein
VLPTILPDRQRWRHAVLPLWKVLAGAPTLANLQPGPQGPGFFLDHGLLPRGRPRRAYREPSSIETAVKFCEALLDRPHCQIVEPRERHWEIFTRLCIDTNTRGPDAADAWYAALAIEWGCERITLDRDYARFPGLRRRTPDEVR